MVVVVVDECEFVVNRDERKEGGEECSKVKVRPGRGERPTRGRTKDGTVECGRYR